MLMSMKYLFDGHGHHIANMVNGQLHAPAGQNVGHYLENRDIFIDLIGGYLGEIVDEDRLVRHRNSPHRSVNYGAYGNYGNIGRYNSGTHGPICITDEYEDIPLELLQ